MSNDCLVCGSPKSGKKYLINKLISDVKFDKINDNESKCVWSIANKYYTSDVTLNIINSTDLITSKTQYQAIILILNLGQPQV